MIYIISVLETDIA